MVEHAHKGLRTQLIICARIFLNLLQDCIGTTLSVVDVPANSEASMLNSYISIFAASIFQICIYIG